MNEEGDMITETETETHGFQKEIHQDPLAT
jgi:hypothetical protein